jgi:hypothetical protein
MNVTHQIFDAFRPAAALQWQSPQMLAGALLVAAAIVTAVALLYPAQVRSLPAAWRWTLPGLRCLALVLLAASLARPIAQRVLGDEEQGAYVVLVDNSRSMATVDTQRSKASFVALADGLGLLPGVRRTRAEEFKAIEGQIDRLPGLFDTITQAQVDLDYAALQGRDNPAAKERFQTAHAEFKKVTKELAAAREKSGQKSKRFGDAVEALTSLPKVEDDDWQERAARAIDSLTALSGQFQNDADDELYRRDAHVRQVCEELSKWSRLDLAERAIVDPTSGLLSKLPAKAPLYGYTIGSGARPLGLRGGTGQNIKRLLIQPDAPSSDVTGGLRAVLDQLRHQKISAIVVLSDGRQVGQDPSVSAGIAGTGVPVYGVLAAPQRAAGRLRDIAIERVEMPSPANIFVGETLNLTAHVVWTLSSALPKPTEVTLQTGAYQLRAPIEESGNNAGRGLARFSIQFDDPGPQRITLSVKSQNQEITDANNSVERWVKVLADRFEVLLLGGEPSWDYRYLRNTLSRTRWVNLRTTLLDAEDARLDLTPQQIATFDVIILSDVPTKALAPEQWDAVRRVVTQRGGSAILMAGLNHLPREYGGGFAAEFLPYKRAASAANAPTLWRTWPGEDPEFRFVPAPGLSDAELDLLALADDRSESWYRWNALPPVFRYFAMPDLKDAVTPMLVERDGRSPVLTRQRLGRGKVFFLGIDETWRWRAKSGDRDQDRFFRQLVRAAADEPYAVSNGLLSLDTDRVVIRPGESARVRARVVDPGAETWAWGTPAPTTSIDLEVRRADGSPVRVQSLPASGEPGSGRFEGRVGDLEPGHYVLRLKAAYGAGVEYPLHVAENYERETLDLTGDAELLQRLARSSGGEFRTLENFEDVPRLLAESRKRAPRLAELRLWDSWYLYAVVVSALGAEWALRKRFGLA